MSYNLGDECSYSSEYDQSDNYKSNQYSDENGCDMDFTPTTILNPHGTNDRSMYIFSRIYYKLTFQLTENPQLF